jgi:hypothetical protein
MSTVAQSDGDSFRHGIRNALQLRSIGKIIVTLQSKIQGVP